LTDFISHLFAPAPATPVAIKGRLKSLQCYYR
jgi:hypothetical protein